MIAARALLLVVCLFEQWAGAAKRDVPLPGVHAFFYVWYGTVEVDGNWTHWDHEVLDHWNPEISQIHKKAIGSKHNPPSNLHSAYYPLQGAYSSRDPNNLDAQFATMQAAGIDVAVVSWWGQPTNERATDTQGVASDLAIDDVFQAAERNGHVKVMLHLEPYPGRSEATVRSDLEYIMEKYSKYPSLYRSPKGFPCYYMYDSYHIQPHAWQRLLTVDGDITVRGTALDALFIGLWLDSGHGRDLKDAGFDGAYSYFASEGFSYGSTVAHWKTMVTFCNAYSLLSSLSVGPGYDDSAIRPWNRQNTKFREDGMYYEGFWEEALVAGPSFVSITSYNEWGEGTQIEPAREVLKSEGYEKAYSNYGKGGPHLYINITEKYATTFRERALRQQKKYDKEL